MGMEELLGSAGRSVKKTRRLSMAFHPIVFFVPLILFAQIVLGDLPIHANTNDVAGKWMVHLGTAHSHPTKCSSTVPNSNTGNLDPSVVDFMTWLQHHGGTSKSIPIELSLDRQAISTDGGIAHRSEWHRLAARSTDGSLKGYWTMVYDEGFEARLGPYNLMGFMKYAPANDSCPPARNGDSEGSDGTTECYATDASRTHIGWYSVDGSKKQYGCFYAVKIGGEDGQHSFVVVKKSLPVLPNENLGSYLESFVQVHNQKDSSWTARAHSSLASVGDNHAAKLMGHLGFKKYHVNSSSGATGMSFMQSKSEDTSMHGLYACKSRKQADTAALPKNFSWGDPFTTDAFQETPINQGNCGSCYSIAATYALQKRFEIALRKAGVKNFNEFQKAPLSPQSVVSCSFFNQGCDGGYPYLVGKWAKEDGVSSTECMNYNEKAKCKWEAEFSDLDRKVGLDSACSEDERWFAKDYGYVGGAYELCGEREMMDEIHSNGPIAVAIEAPRELFGYSEGVFDSSPENHHRYCSDQQGDLNGWEYTNHALVVVGWGEQPSEGSGDALKYWIVRNSWGDSWGRNGYVKIKRGRNLGGIESQAVYLDPDLTRGRAAQVLAKYDGTKAIRRHSQSELGKQSAAISAQGKISPN